MPEATDGTEAKGRFHICSGWKNMGENGKGGANIMHRWQSKRTIIYIGNGEKLMWCYVGDQALFLKIAFSMGLELENFVMRRRLAE